MTGIKATQCGVEIKLADKVKALELMGKHLGMFNGGGSLQVDIEDDPLTKSIEEAVEHGAI